MATTRCPVCGCGELERDEVVDRGLLILTECPRCEHRAVERVPGVPRRVRIAAEAAGAAA